MARAYDREGPREESGPEGMSPTCDQLDTRYPLSCYAR
jgi:hypothetical protein